jgi:hypothetical protein
MIRPVSVREPAAGSRSGVVEDIVCGPDRDRYLAGIRRCDVLALDPAQVRARLQTAAETASALTEPRAALAAPLNPQCV